MTTRRAPQRNVHPRTAAATAAATAKRARRAQETAAAKLAAVGWTCFPPEKRTYLEQFLAAHQGDECPGPARMTPDPLRTDVSSNTPGGTEIMGNGYVSPQEGK